jgi:rhodanese-related sulfurtransferase
MQTTPRTATQLVADARMHIQNLSPEQVAAELGSDQVLLVDLREPVERTQSGFIAGGTHAPRGMLEFYADPSSAYHRADFDPNRRTILYCASGGRSALAGDSLRQLGYTNVAHLDGGIKAWIASGRDVSRD